MNDGVKSLLKSTVKTAKEIRYHRIHTMQALRILKGLERHGVKLRDSDKKLCDGYAVDALGNKHFAPWLYVFTAVSGEFKEGWIPDNYYGSIVVPKITGEYGKVSSLKPLNAVIFQSDLFPDILSYANGVFFDAQYQLVPKKDVASRLFRDQDRVIFKLDSSLQGLGIHFFNKDDFNVDRVQSLGNGLFQGFIKQHGLFAEFSRNSVATVRITTVYRDNGEVSVQACYLRFGNSNETHVQSKTHVRVPIGLEAGSFHDIGYTAQWMAIKAHPSSNVGFAGRSIPNFRDCCDKVTALHKQMPYNRCIGWDIAVDHEEKVKIMEWNAGHNDIKFSEATQGPCFADLGWSELHKKEAL